MNLLSCGKPRILVFWGLFVKGFGPVITRFLLCKSLFLLYLSTFCSILDGMSNPLPWPLESASHRDREVHRWSHAGSNLCLDFHGDPLTAGLTVFSDGNHHMALEASLEAFREATPEVRDVFYATTPPGVLVNYLTSGQLWLGNLCLSRLPDVFISPPEIMNKLQRAGHIQRYRPFMQSRGNVLLVRKGNPKKIRGVADLLRDDVRLFISNPVTEKASYDVYSESIMNLAQEQSLDMEKLKQRLSGTDSTVFGQLIHHREAPQCLYDGRADVAMVYYHLALRYTRIFPNDFEFIPLGGQVSDPQPAEGNLCTTYHIAAVNDAADFCEPFMAFMFDDRVTQIYRQHGLTRPAP